MDSTDKLNEEPPTTNEMPAWAMPAIAFGGLVVVGVVGFALFSPSSPLSGGDTDGDGMEVIDPSDFLPGPDGSAVISQGIWQDRDYATAGHVSVIQWDSDDSVSVYFHDDIDTVQGPDLELWITDSPTLLTNAELNASTKVNLGQITDVTTATTYDVNSADEAHALAAKSVAIECEGADLLWGAAILTPNNITSS